MSACLSKSLRLSSTLKIEEEAMVTKNQGIGSILGSDCERNKSSSLRRTLSADMSSTKWLTQHGFSPIKKIASSKEFSISSITDSEEEEEEEKDYEDKETETEADQQSQFDFWNSIQEEMYKKKELEKPGEFDMWSSIISQKAQDASNKSLPPYIHPLVKRSSSSLSKKSLEICTESLGSETGSDGFSSYPSSETSDTDDDKEIEQEQPLQQQQEEERMEERFDVEEVTVPKYNYVFGKKSPQRSFPPPIPSLSRHDGASIRMQSRRDNGRLVLEAVSVPCTNNFSAQRQDGRLVLTFVNKFSTHEEAITMEEEDEDEDKEVEVFDEEEEEEEETEEEEVEESENENRGSEMEIEFVMDEQAPKLSSEVISVHRLTLVMNKHLGLAKTTNPSWSNKFNEVVKFDEVEDIKPPTSSLLAQSLPPAPTMARLIPKPPATAAATVSSAAGATFNAYEYFWRPKPLTSGPGPVSKLMKNQQPQQINSKLIVSKKMNPVENEQQQVVLLSENKGDYLVSLSKGCKEPRRSLLFWEPHCIATS